LTRFLLDTNVVRDATRPQPSEAVAAWLANQLDADLFISTLTLGELRRGILQLPAGRKRRTLAGWFDGPDGPRVIFGGRILGFDEAAAEAWARLMAEGVRLGAPRSALDMIIAAIAVANGCVVATCNERHFAGVVPLLNPMRP
jgi:hypothetical protein